MNYRIKINLKWWLSEGSILTLAQVPSWAGVEQRFCMTLARAPCRARVEQTLCMTLARALRQANFLCKFHLSNMPSEGRATSLYELDKVHNVDRISWELSVRFTLNFAIESKYDRNKHILNFHYCIQ